MDDDQELESYGDTGIYSKDTKVAKPLIYFYIFLGVWGIVWMALYWNGVHGWLDRGYWNELEKAANTTFPLKNYTDPDQPVQEVPRSKNG